MAMFVGHLLLHAPSLPLQVSVSATQILEGLLAESRLISEYNGSPTICTLLQDVFQEDLANMDL